MKLESVAQTFFLVILFLANPLTANAFLQGTNPPDKHRNDLSQCSERIQVALRNHDSKRWGTIQFDCENGLLKTIHTSTSAPLTSDWQKYVLSNPGILGLRLRDIRINKHWPKEWTQQWHGIHINYTRIEDAAYASYNEGQRELSFHLTTTLVDTGKWHLSTAPKISSKKAAQASLKVWKMDSPGTIEIAADPELEINISGPASCGTSADPRLVWSVQGFPDQNHGLASFNCMIDAQTGVPCNPVACPEQIVLPKKY